MGSNQQTRSTSLPTHTYYSVVFEVHGTRAYTDPFNHESDAEDERDTLKSYDCVTDVRVVDHQDSAGEDR